MERREALKKTSWILTSAFFAPGVLSFLESCKQKDLKNRTLLVLNDNQDDLVNSISDTIIPRTTTPGASDVKVNKFIDVLLSDVFENEIKDKFLDGLIEFDRTCQSITGKSFSKLGKEEQFNYLEKVDREIMGKQYGEKAPFYYLFKILTITTYFSTKQGVIQNLNYLPIPGPYQGNVDYKEGDKIIVGNQM